MFSSPSDIAIGAFKSGHAIIIRSKPVIKLDGSVQLFDSELKNNQKNFTAEICLHYRGMSLPSEISKRNTYLFENPHGDSFQHFHN